MADAETMRVLVAEDDDDTRNLVCTILERAGHEVTAARSGAEAWDLARTSRPQALVIDLKMPGMDGLELTEAVRADDGLKSLPIVLLTAEVRGWEVAKIFGAGVSSYLPKPFSSAGLLEALAAAVSASRGP
jgi:CheY-like chemotaxis protein